MQKLLIVLALAIAGCSTDALCHGPAPRTGTGWCPKMLAPGQCEITALCAGYCIPDGGSLIDERTMPYRCDASTP